MSFLRLLLDLLPTGPYSKDPDALHVRELQSVAELLEEADDDVAALLDELFPDTAEETLADWERVFGIVPASTATTAQRQAAVAAAYGRQPTISKTYIEQAMETFTGVDVSIVEEIPPLYDVALYDVDTYFAWSFQVVVSFADAAAAGIELPELIDAQAFLDSIKPGHTQGTLLVGGARYDNPSTLLDRSTYGV